jgi:hypothetical protein
MERFTHLSALSRPAFALAREDDRPPRERECSIYETVLDLRELERAGKIKRTR